MSDSRYPVALIGVGDMGAAMAANLLEQGWPVHVCDRIAKRNQAMAALGATPHQTPADAAQAAGLVILCVQDAAQTRDVLFGKGQVADAMHLGHCVMLCMRMAPEEVEQIGLQLRPFGLHCIEAPIAGSPAQAREGRMGLMVACPPTLFERHRELIAALSSQVVRVGEHLGDGARAARARELAAGIQPVDAASPRIPAGIWALGFVSMLMDISSEMIHSLLPLFLVGTLGASAVLVGLIEGLAESTALIVKVFSGALSDYLGRRKGLAVFGYALGALTKPLFAVAPSIGVVLTARVIDRIGKGVRGAPRDALVADIAPPQVRGAAFGLRQTLDTVGAFVGPLLAVGLMLLWANDFRAVFWVAVIPGVLAVLLLMVGVREPVRRAGAKGRNPIRRENLQQLGRGYWWVVGVGAMFTLARFSEAFLVLRAEQGGIAVALVPLVMVAMNAVYAASAYPFGTLSDRMSHKTLLAWGLVVLIAADLVLAIDGHWTYVLAGVALWGVHMGMTQGLLATMVADTAPADLRGTAFGFFNLVSGIAMLVASVLAGLLWDRLGASFTFYAGGAFCVLALLCLPRLREPPAR